MHKNSTLKSNVLFILKETLYVLLLGLMAFEIINLISKVVSINLGIKIVISIVSGVLLDLLIILIKHKINKERKEKLDSYIKMHLLDLIYLYIFIFLFFLALNNINKLSILAFDKMLSIIWTILGLSITIFIFGYVLVDSYLGGVKRDNKNKKVDINNYYDVENFINDNNKYVYKINEMNFPITMLLINAITNSVATGFIIFAVDTLTDFKKVFIILSLVLSINTFLSLITNICMPFIKEKNRCNKLKKKQDNELNKMYIEFLENKEKDNINKFVEEKINETNIILDHINNGMDISSELDNLDIDEVINNIQNYSKYFNKDNLNEDILKLKNNIKEIMEKSIDKKLD